MPADDAIVVAFRSTVSIQNWIVNLDATQVIRVIYRFLILDAQDVKFIKASIMLLLESKDILEMKFKN